ncbi:MAG: hypothetical protein H6623_07450 [Bdellovibrionaceae bacterium]|nr:hypothetical protein [Pseudobdellovibrionaceae bacterium]
MKKIVGLMTILWALSAVADVPIQKDRNEAEYNKEFAVALDGYDPVSYFEEGGGTPLKGDAAIEFVYGTIIYHFANMANMEMFKTNPAKYEPTYGSWCAYAMSEGSRIKIKPLIYTIHGNRIHFFVAKSAKKTFDDELESREPVADMNWKGFSGEEPRK